MAEYFTDSSALVKRYVSESGSAWVTALFDPSAGNEIFVAAIAGVEIVAAVARRVRGGAITASDATSIYNQLRLDWLSDYQIVEVNDLLLQQAMSPAEAINGAASSFVARRCPALRVSTVFDRG